MKEKEVVVVNPSHRMLSGLGLLAIGLFLTQFWFRREMTVKSDFVLLVVILFFYLTSLYTIFSWSKTRFTVESTKIVHEVYHFGVIKLVKQLQFSEVYYLQVPQLIPSFRVCLKLSEGTANDIIVKEGMRKKEADEVYRKISLLCGLPVPEPEEPKVKVDEFEDDDDFDLDDE